MDFLTDDIKTIYFKYLKAAFGSALITSIYGMVDMAMVGNYQGPDGTAALSIVMPIWNMIYSIGLLFGIGGSVMMSMLRGESEDNIKKSNQYYTIALICAVIVSIIIWIAIAFFDKQILIAFGANDTLLPLAREYIQPIKVILPVFLLNQFLTCFIRNDSHPNLATIAVLIGGIFNMFGDYFFVFIMNWGLYGAGFATACGSVLTFIVMMTHFTSSINSLSIEKTTHIFSKIKRIIINGFSTFFIDIAIGIVTILFNRQLLTYLGNDAISVYGVIVNVSLLIQCCTYAIGQASQPIMSQNYGANNKDRILKTRQYALYTVFILTVISLILTMSVPNVFVKLFMKPTDSVLQIAPTIIRIYSFAFLFLPYNVFATYYFQSIMKAKESFIVSLLRGALISSLCIIILPLIYPNAIWLSMPIAELITFIYAYLKRNYD